MDISPMKMQKIDGINTDRYLSSEEEPILEIPRQTEMPTVKAVKYLV